MCGIAGVYAPPGTEPVTRPVLERMIGTLHHRGPDGYGYHVADGIGLAHARLSIIDLSTGDQPIRNEDGTIQVVFNGEIFNYVELRAALERQGHRFYTASDTEVIVHLYEQHGDAFVDHLNGQFAIALWDARRRRLVLARDRVGIRPLYYALSRGRLIFGSEVKALLAEGSTEPRLDVDSLLQTFSYWSPLEGRSAFVGVESLPPGHMMTVDEDGSAGRPLRTSVRRYWDWDFGHVDPRPVTADTVAELLALLEDAVRLQLRADVPVGAYFSGGLDSTAITGIIHRITQTPVRAFSLAFEGAEYDESAHQRLAADALAVERTEYRCTSVAIADGFARAVRHAEAPLVRTAPVPMMLLSGHVRSAGYKVVLTGEGADEVFAGYDLFREAKIRRWAASHPGSAWRGRLLERLYPYLAASPTRGRAFSQGFFAAGAEQPQRPSFAHLPRIRATQRVFQLLSPALKARAQTFDAATTLDAIVPASATAWPPLGRDQYVEAHTLLSGYLLGPQGDRAAMANSIEGRYPYLDHRVIEFASRLPPSARLSVLREKHVLKQAVAPYVPEEIRRRVKQPYRAPDSESFFVAGRPHELVEDLLSASSLRAAGYFDERAVAHLVEKCRAGRALGFGDNMAFVGVLSTMALHEAFVRE